MSELGKYLRLAQAHWVEIIEATKRNELKTYCEKIVGRSLYDSAIQSMLAKALEVYAKSLIREEKKPLIEETENCSFRDLYVIIPNEKIEIRIMSKV